MNRRLDLRFRGDDDIFSVSLKARDYAKRLAVVPWPEDAVDYVEPGGFPCSTGKNGQNEISLGLSWTANGLAAFASLRHRNRPPRTPATAKLRCPVPRRDIAPLLAGFVVNALGHDQLRLAAAGSKRRPALVAQALDRLGFHPVAVSLEAVAAGVELTCLAV